MSYSNAHNRLSHRAIIDRAGGPAAVGHSIGVDPNTTKGWKRLDSIPSAYWHDLQVAGVATLDELALAAAVSKRGDFRPAPNDQRTHDATSAINDDPGPEAERDEPRVILCSVCELRLEDQTRRNCNFRDCPHSESLAA